MAWGVIGNLTPAAEAGTVASRRRATMPPMTDYRLTELEIKASYTEDLLDRLNEVVIRQQQQIDRLQREVAALREQVDQAPSPAFRSLRDDLPPHF